MFDKEEASLSIEITETMDGLKLEGPNRKITKFLGLREHLIEAMQKIESLEQQVEKYKGLVKEASDYLDTNELTSIGSTSIMHRKFKEAL